MDSYPTFFDAILAAEEALGAAVIICDAREQEVVFIARGADQETFPCIINDGYLRYLENGELRLTKKTDDTRV